MSGQPGETMTLMLSVSAIHRLAAPGAAIRDARQWSDQVGVVGDGNESVEDVEAFVDDLDADPDFVAGPASGSLASIRQRVYSERHVVVGTSERHRDIAAALGWEYLPVEEAAENAEWQLADTGDLEASDGDG